MTYLEQIEELYEKNPGFSAVVETIQRLKKNPRILNFSHHDLDGISSAFILKRLFERKLGAKMVIRMPQHFKLWEETLVETLKQEGKFDLLVISDKGTFEYYDELLKHIDPIVIIDHHQLDGKPKNCVLFNPTVQSSDCLLYTSPSPRD